jgi:hypothetical protein
MNPQPPVTATVDFWIALMIKKTVRGTHKHYVDNSFTRMEGEGVMRD